MSKSKPTTRPGLDLLESPALGLMGTKETRDPRWEATVVCTPARCRSHRHRGLARDFEGFAGL